jgi:predicted nucleic acid-binding protein
MSGNNYLLDTNALINFFQGNESLQKFSHVNIFLSVISILEFLSFSNITNKDQALLKQFVNEAQIIDLSVHDEELQNIIVSIRIAYKLKLPDAIIAASAINNNATLITNDKDFSRIPSLHIIHY